MATVKFIVDLLSAGAAFAAALFWLRASLVKTPTEFRKARALEMLDGPFGDDVIAMAKGVSKQSRLNAWAAAFAATAAILTGISVLIGTRWG